MFVWGGDRLLQKSDETPRLKMTCPLPTGSTLRRQLQCNQSHPTVWAPSNDFPHDMVRFLWAPGNAVFMLA